MLTAILFALLLQAQAPQAPRVRIPMAGALTVEVPVVLVGSPVTFAATHDGKNTTVYILYVNKAPVKELPVSALVAGTVTVPFDGFATPGDYSVQLSAVNRADPTKPLESFSSVLTVTAAAPPTDSSAIPTTPTDFSLRWGTTRVLPVIEMVTPANVSANNVATVSWTATDVARRNLISIAQTTGIQRTYTVTDSKGRAYRALGTRSVVNGRLVEWWESVPPATPEAELDTVDITVTVTANNTATFYVTGFQIAGVGSIVVRNFTVGDSYLHSCFPDGAHDAQRRTVVVLCASVLSGVGNALVPIPPTEAKALGGTSAIWTYRTATSWEAQDTRFVVAALRPSASVALVIYGR